MTIFRTFENGLENSFRILVFSQFPPAPSRRITPRMSAISFYINPEIVPCRFRQFHVKTSSLHKMALEFDKTNLEF